jgi:hypothetical protein
MEVSDQIHVPDALTPRKEIPEPTEQEAGWVPESGWTRRGERTRTPAESQNLVIQASHYTDWATPVHPTSSSKVRTIFLFAGRGQLPSSWETPT